MSNHAKIRRINTLRYIVASRWFLHGGIVILGILQKVIGVASFNPGIFLLLAISYSYNAAFYWYLHRPIKQITWPGLRKVALLQVVLDQIMYTVILYASGGVESLSFMFYFITIFIAIVLFNEYQILALSFATLTAYVAVIWLEFAGIIPHLARYPFDSGVVGNLGATVHNTATVVLIMIFTSFFAAFISNLIRTRENEITSERDKLTSIVDNLVDGVLLLDPEGKVVSMNPYAQRVLHVNVDDYVGKSLEPAQFTKNLRELLEFIHGVGMSGAYRNEEITVTEPTTSIILQVTALPIATSRSKRVAATYGTLVIMRNITREKDLDQMKSEFISVAAHQLRTPLATLKWLFKIMLDGDAGELTAKQRDLLQKGYGRNTEVIEIVNNLLDVSEIEEGRFPYKFASESLLPLLQNAASETQDNAVQRDITVDDDLPASLPAVNHDKQKLKMAIQNLLDNAVKYSHTGSTIHLKVWQESDRVYIQVKDEGIGMSDETKKRLFTKFYRGKEAAAHEPTGSGLGLYIVRNIVQRHAGKVAVESKLGEGTTFTINLPVAE